MSSFYDDASLVVIPSGYKASKVYSQKPTDGTGDLTFTRALDTATRVAPNGLIERVRTNLALHSQDLTNAAYTASFGASGAVTRTANFAAAPDGSMTATRVQITRGSVFSELLQRKSISLGVEFSVSFFGKLNSGTATLNSVWNNGYFNEVTFTNDWQRFTFTSNAQDSSPNNIGLNLITFTSLPNTTATADVLIWGVQIETGVATPYIPTTTAAVSVGMLANVPRLDYLGGGCPRLLLEPQRTNLVTFSEQFNNAAYGKTNITITANNATSPDGYQNADTSLADGVNAVHIIASNLISFTSGTAYSFSVFAKKGTNNFMQLIISSTVGGMFANFDLNNGTVGTLGTLTGTTPTSSIVDYGNGWYRCVMNFTPTATTSAYANFVIVTSASAARAEANTLSTSVILWGAQLEAGAYPTSYIPTLGAAVTRSADAASKTGISALIGQTEGTLFAGVDLVASANGRIIAIDTGSLANFINIILDGNFNLRIAIRKNTGTIVTIISGAVGVLGANKMALSYENGDYKFFLNGVLAGSSNNSTDYPVGTISRMVLSDAAYGASDYRNSQTLLFKTRLTNAQLAELTA